MVLSASSQLINGFDGNHRLAVIMDVSMATGFDIAHRDCYSGRAYLVLVQIHLRTMNNGDQQFERIATDGNSNRTRNALRDKSRSGENCHWLTAPTSEADTAPPGSIPSYGQREADGFTHFCQYCVVNGWRLCGARR